MDCLYPLTGLPLFLQSISQRFFWVATASRISASVPQDIAQAARGGIRPVKLGEATTSIAKRVTHMDVRSGPSACQEHSWRGACRRDRAA
jgi:hypothetical protein